MKVGSIWYSSINDILFVVTSVSGKLCTVYTGQFTHFLYDYDETIIQVVNILESYFEHRKSIFYFSGTNNYDRYYLHHGLQH